MKARVSTLKNKKRPVAKKMNGNLITFGKRLAKLEGEIAVIRRELAKALKPITPKKQDKTELDVLSDFRADHAQLQQVFDQLFEELSIKGKPIPAEELQKMMGEIGLETNELSQAITAAREE